MNSQEFLMKRENIMYAGWKPFNCRIPTVVLLQMSLGTNSILICNRIISKLVHWTSFEICLLQRP